MIQATGDDPPKGQITAVPTFDLFSIGQSNIDAERFVAMLRQAKVNAIADVRSIPASRRFPWFAKKNLEARLAADGIAYIAMGDTLGGRPRDDSLYCEGVADYEAMAATPEFQSGLNRLIEAASRTRVCMMCAEREPLDCHRCLLVARSLAARGLSVGHILHDGTIEAHEATEQRLLKLYGERESCDLFASGQHEALTAAYRRRARAVAFRQEVPAPSAAAEHGR
jgi:uncharacterized protein (DUF488 family)